MMNYLDIHNKSIAKIVVLKSHDDKMISYSTGTLIYTRMIRVCACEGTGK